MKEIVLYNSDINLIKSRILELRGQKVLIDRDLAGLYNVSTGRLNEQVKRNIKRFPKDFMFQMTKDELNNWISQNAISNPSIRKGVRKLPLVFTREGIAMLSSVLKSEKAIQVNILIMRAFVHYYDILPNPNSLVKEIEEIKSKIKIHDDRLEANFKSIMYILRNLPPKKRDS